MVLTIQNGQKPEKGVIPFSEALEKTKFGKFNYFLIIIAGLVLANVLLETASIGFILPISQCDLKLTNQDKGILSAIGFAGIILSSHLWGFLADTKGRRKVILPTLLMAFVFTVLSSFSHTFWVLVLLRLVNGFFVSGGSATIYAYLGEFHTDRSRARAMMGSSFIFALGAMILPLIAWLIINQSWTLPISFLGITYKPWRFFMIVCGIPGFLCGLFLIFLPESPKFLLSVGKDKEAIDVLKRMYRWNVGDDTEFELNGLIPEKDTTIRKDEATDKQSNIVTAFLKTMWAQTVPLFEKKYCRITVIICTIQFWMYVTTNGMYMWFPHIANSMVEFMKEHPGNRTLICEVVYAKHASIYKEDGTINCQSSLEDNTFMYSLVMEILYATGFAVIGVIINKVGKIPILFVVLVFFASCGIASIHVDNPSISVYLYVLLFLAGVGINVLGAATVELYPTHLRSMAICISLMFGRLGSVVGANIVGLLLAKNCESTFYISTTALILCGFLAFLIPKEQKQKGDEEAGLED
ncbi:synaptic vesicle glycoprotein 2B-like isoform X2 [Eupeodes corollae]|uniref:synaptic vesicle glycoprotein 2B-like isoform X2 n=1 Tax=Eupeodes corollae TaxID=290404 RepID=UPI0024901782|nr:synaptic vesicle glycoprotein 2B-like isoform X2 [Eupeodes corollae]